MKRHRNELEMMICIKVVRIHHVPLFSVIEVEVQSGLMKILKDSNSMPLKMKLVIIAQRK